RSSVPARAESSAGLPGGPGSPGGHPASGWWRSGIARRGPTHAPRTARAAPGDEQRLLEQVLGVLRRADDPVDVQLQLTPEGVGQLAERVLVAGARTGEGLLGHARILAKALPFTRITTNDVGAARNSPLSSRRGRRLNKRS